jgi:replicative DNA helicase
VNLIGARPKQGKSVLSKDCALHVSTKLNIPVLYLDTEMQGKQQLTRIISGLSRIDISRIETGKFGKSEAEMARVIKAFHQHENVPFYHISIAGKDFEEIIAIVRRWLMRVVGYNTNGKLNDCSIINRTFNFNRFHFWWYINR